MQRQSLTFVAPYQVEVRPEEFSPPDADHRVVVRTILSAISPGTEMLIYRGQAPADLPADESIAALAGSLAFPLKYGYCAVGRVIEVGQQVDPAWLQRLVFAFNPHETLFSASPDDLLPVPDGVGAEDAVFLPNMETAVNFVMDGRPLLGEQVAVFGQGVVGLLTAALLARFPLAALLTFDRHPLRRKASLRVGAAASLDPADADAISHARHLLGASGADSGADLTVEVSGVPEALDQAIALTGAHGRVIIGSWYGQKRSSLALGGRFHRSRIQLIGSQVSTISPSLIGRWDKQRRFQVAWEAIRSLTPSQFITHRVPFENAPAAYRLCDQQPGETMQVILTYGQDK